MELPERRSITFLLFIIASLLAVVFLASCSKDTRCGEISYNANTGVSSQFRQECCPNTYHWPVRQQYVKDGHSYNAEGWIKIFLHTEGGVRELTAQYWEFNSGVVLWIDGTHHYMSVNRIEYLIGQTICH